MTRGLPSIVKESLKNAPFIMLESSPQSRKLTLEQNLVKFKISREHYNKQFISLCEANFTNEQANRLILQPNSNKSVMSVLENHQLLLSDTFGFIREEIISIAARWWGYKNIEAVKSTFADLTALKFKPYQIAKIASHVGGDKNILAVKSEFAFLTTLNFLQRHIVDIAGKARGFKNIETVKTLFKELTAYKFSLEQITEIVSHDDGSQNLKAVHGALSTLITTFHLSPKDITNIARHRDGARNIEATIKYYPSLLEKGINKEASVKILSRRKGYKIVQVLL